MAKNTLKPKSADDMALFQKSLVKMELKSLLVSIEEEVVPPRLTFLADRLIRALIEQQTKK
ncbi:hypothetical protein [Pseudaminobacter soli (ex Li et al. 2025)]|uniref:Uncharacterized protein n=1 Tax=Pseudaminobacter soli (ex Li et al. 2025) TaxID=1295366 RepID=A0A2P7S171_9HYPH|nr:hypothetical protein [Mesorhizobium soli]PSJ56214.1 hypothetical protein C7I85_24845 [Mesorhizobium soli]